MSGRGPLRSWSAWRKRRAIWRDMDEEMRQHVALEAEDLTRQGVPPDEAARRARLAFGPTDSWRETGWEARLPRWFDDLWRDARVSLRSLRRSPGFTVMAVTCIALGIGITAAVFALVDAVLLRPLPYARADRLVAIYSSNEPKGYKAVNISRPDFESWRDQARVFTGIGMWAWSDITLSGNGDAERVSASDVTPGLFTMLGVRPALGRDFVAAEGVAGRDNVLLISDALWKRRFAADPGVLGKTVLVEGAPSTIVGVMPPDFGFPQTGEAWRPLPPDPERDGRANRFYAGAIGRLRDGVTFDRGAADLARISSDLQRAFPDDEKDWVADAVPMRDDLVGDLKRPVMVFAGAVICVLLIACANVANLLLARGAARRRELAVRTAIGAGRGRVVRQLITESLVLAAIGALLGTVLTIGGVRLAASAFPRGVPYYLHLAIDARVIGFIAVLAAFTAVAFGTLPALRASDLDLGGTLKEGSAGTGEGARRVRARGALVVAEVALSLVLLVAAGLLVRSYRALVGTNLGFDEHGVLAFQVSMPDGAYPEEARRAALLSRILERLRDIPGVEAAGSARGLPLTGWDTQAGATVEGRPPAKRGDEVVVHYQTVTPDYFKVMRVPLLRGRGFNAQDDKSQPLVVLVSERFVSTFLPGQDPIGKRVRLGGEDSDPWATIVGVVGNFQQYRLPEKMTPAVFYDWYQLIGNVQTVVLRTSRREAAALAPDVRAAMREIDPGVPVYDMRTMEEVVARSFWRQRLQGQTLGIFAALALLLALVGLYGVVAYSVGQRRREIGLRVALGASARDVVGTVVAQGARLAATGILIGLLAALLVIRALADLLYEVKPFDPVTFIGMPLLLALVALAASAVPAWSAARTDPQRVLRAE